MRPNPHFPADLVTFIEEIHNGKLHFLCSEIKIGGSKQRHIQNTVKNLQRSA